MSWICPHCGSSHDTTACPTLFRPYTAAPEDPVLDRLLEPPVHYCTHWEMPAEPPESRELADVHQVLDAWERDPHRTLPDLIARLAQLAERELPTELAVGEPYVDALREAVAGDSPAPPGVRALFADEEPS